MLIENIKIVEKKMIENFWKNIEKPIIAAAPMEDITDTVYREILLQNAKAENIDVIFTEFVSVDGLNHKIGKEKVSYRLEITPEEQKLLIQKNVKIVAQIWGNNPENFYKAAKSISEEYNFDGIDVNMGCPVKNIVKQGSGAALIKEPELAKEIIIASKEATELPISVKTRIGFTEVVTENWISNIIQTKPAAITLHGRTKKMMYKGEADWNQIAIAAKLTKEANIPIIGNGDIRSIEQAKEYSEKYNTNGAMIGRALLTNPWVFAGEYSANMEERKKLLLAHSKKFLEVWRDTKNFSMLKKYFKVYISTFDGAAELRHKFMQAKSIEDVEKLI